MKLKGIKNTASSACTDIQAAQTNLFSSWKKRFCYFALFVSHLYFYKNSLKPFVCPLPPLSAIFSPLIPTCCSGRATHRKQPPPLHSSRVTRGLNSVAIGLTFHPNHIFRLRSLTAEVELSVCSLNTALPYMHHITISPLEQPDKGPDGPLTSDLRLYAIWPGC